MATLKFGFKKTITPNPLRTLKSKFGERDDDADKEVKDFVHSMEGNKLNGRLKKSEDVKNELIIPIIQKRPKLDEAIRAAEIRSSGDDQKLDVTLRAEESTLDDYERIPIEQFGLAMLRGMGWKKSEGIGLRNKRVVDIKEPILRPRGLGLGAERPNVETKN